MGYSASDLMYIDANIFIYAANSASENFLACKNILLQIAEGEIKAATSVLTWDEFFWVTRRILGMELAKTESSKFLNMPNLKFLPADESVIRAANKFACSYNIGPRDALHAATALSSNAACLVSDDQDFDRVKEIKRMGIEKWT